MKNMFCSRSSRTSLLSFHGRWMMVLSLLLLTNGIGLLSASAALSVPAGMQQQGVKLTGIVTDTKGVPIVGCNVIVKGTTTGTSTDINGKFTLNVSKKEGVVVVSFVGFVTKDIAYRSDMPLTVQLEEQNSNLEQLVVVGYGTQRKATVTGSVTSVKGNDLKQSPAPNLSNAIVGRMPGVIANNRSGEPGNDFAQILIRGKGTLNDNSPLYVIDGVANRGGIERLNPSDIESISVLKDASAAIYGAQAANGVILVTTKRGKSSKPTITYDGNFGVSQNTRTPDLMDAYQYMTYADEISGYMGWTQLYKDVKNGYLDGTIDKRQWANTDWMKVIFRPFAPQTQHSLSVRGGNESVKYFLSGGYLYQEPGYRNTNQNFTTAQVRANIDANITKDLTVSLEYAQREEDRNQSVYDAGTIFWEGFHAYPFLPDFYENGLPGPGLAWGNNLAILNSGKAGYNRVKDNFYNTKVAFDLKLPWILKGLSLSGYGARDVQFRRQKQFWNQWDAYRFDPATEEYVNIKPTTGDGYINLGQTDNNYKTSTVNLRLSYEQKFDEHSINMFAAFEQSKNEGDYIYAWRRDFLSDKIDYLFAGGNKDKTNNGSASASARQNIFGRANYAFKDRYLAEVTLRYDGSQIFAPGKRWGFFPGVSLGWRISEEPFMKNNVSFVNSLKLKASWGRLGNDRVNPFQYLNAYNMVDGAIFGTDPQMQKGFVLNRVANPNITWEVADTKNVGFESLLFNSKLSFDLQYFFSDRSNILTRRLASIPLYTGIVPPDQNIGKVTNHGIETELNFRDKVGDIGYFIGGNFTYVKNKIKYLDEAVNTPDWQKRTGYAIDSWLVYRTNGVYNTEDEINSTPHFAGAQPGDIRYVDVDGDGAITANDMVRIHRGQTPEIVYGINMGLSWKGVELNMLWTGQARAMQMIRPGSYNRDVDYYNNRWTSATATPNAKYPRAFDKDDPINNLDSDFWLKNAAFIRLKNVELAYTLPSSLTSKLKMSNVRIFVTGFNLFVIDKIKIQDPEGIQAGGMYYPQQRIYNAGVSISF